MEHTTNLDLTLGPNDGDLASEQRRKEGKKMGCRCSDCYCISKRCGCFKRRALCGQSCKCVNCDNRLGLIESGAASKGCRCSLSRCVKKSCPCRRHNLMCTENCLCGPCQNPFGKDETKDQQQPAAGPDQPQIEA